jgi:hypothetical protein
VSQVSATEGRVQGRRTSTQRQLHRLRRSTDFVRNSRLVKLFDVVLEELRTSGGDVVGDSMNVHQCYSMYTNARATSHYKTVNPRIVAKVR